VTLSSNCLFCTIILVESRVTWYCKNDGSACGKGQCTKQYTLKANWRI
jgi:hypothetical protein